MAHSLYQQFAHLPLCVPSVSRLQCSEFGHPPALQHRGRRIECGQRWASVGGLHNGAVELSLESQGYPDTRIELTECSPKPSECQRTPVSFPDSFSVQRRQAVASALLLLALPTVSLPAFAEETSSNATGDGLKLYEDEKDKYSLLVPQDWTKGEGKAGVRNVTAFFPVDDPSANVNVVITALGADYTKLGSFGTADAFAENLVNSLDRSWTKPPGQAAKLINAASKNGMYYVEYTFQKPGERKRHLLSAVGIGFNGWYNRLFTLTGQFWEDDTEKYKSQVEKAIASFKVA